MQEIPASCRWLSYMGLLCLVEYINEDKQRLQLIGNLKNVVFGLGEVKGISNFDTNEETESYDLQLEWE